MKTQFKVAPHSQIPGAVVLEIWYDNVFIGEITGTDDPGVRVISKYRLYPSRYAEASVFVAEVRIAAGPTSV